MWRKKTDKRIVAAGLLGLALIIGYQSWDDFQLRVRPQPEFTYTPFFLARDTAGLAAVPKETTKVVVWAGDLKADGPVTFTPSNLAPKIFEQREVMVMLNLDNLPADPSAIYEEISKAVEPWKNAGNIINDVYIDYRGDTPDFGALETFVNGLWAYMRREIYVVLQVKRGNTIGDPVHRNKMANLLKGVQYYAYDTKEVAKAGETLTQTISRLDAEGMPFMLRTGTKPDTAALVKEIPEPKQYFQGFLLDSDAPQPQPQEKTP